MWVAQRWFFMPIDIMCAAILLRCEDVIPAGKNILSSVGGSSRGETAETNRERWACCFNARNRLV